MDDSTTLVWLRRDLRLRDNPALNWAASQGPVLAVYVEDSDCAGEAASGAATKWWLHQSLLALDRQLDGKLCLLRGDPQQLLPKLLQQTGITRVAWNRCYEPWQIQRDSQLKGELKAAGIAVKSFNASLLWEPWEVLKQDGKPYKVFTPYYRKGCLKSISPRFPLDAPAQLILAEAPAHRLELEQLQLLTSHPWHQKLRPHWQPGEAGASDRLSQFLSQSLDAYRDDRNRPGISGTSRLSAHLHFGEISPNQVWYAALTAMSGREDDPDLDCFLSELGWREFSYYLLYHFPSLPRSNYNPKFDAFPWQRDATALSAWQRGLTGIPIVDAGMRELWQTGHMHNRVRMVVASFLCKNLLQHWQAGADWFWDCLLDADAASNSASWQWVAGSGADAAPYFRIFNPVTQGEKFDPDGSYVKRYCPELSKLPLKYIHQPWSAPPDVLAQAALQLGSDYPEPIVDLKQSRQRALDAYAQIKQTASAL